MGGGRGGGRGGGLRGGRGRRGRGRGRRGLLPVLHVSGVGAVGGPVEDGGAHVVADLRGPGSCCLGLVAEETVLRVDVLGRARAVGGRGNGAVVSGDLKGQTVSFAVRGGGGG